MINRVAEAFKAIELKQKQRIEARNTAAHSFKQELTYWQDHRIYTAVDDITREHLKPIGSTPLSKSKRILERCGNSLEIFYQRV